MGWISVLSSLLVALCACPAASAAPAELAFAGVHWSRDGSPAGSAIYTIRADGSGMRRLTPAGNWEDTAPAWSPGGKRLAFGHRNPWWRIEVVNADGSGLHALTAAASLAEHPTWSPDGRRIAFAYLPKALPMRGTLAQQIYSVPSGGGKLRPVTRNAAFKVGAGTPDWSPNGRLIAFAAPRSLADNTPTDLWTVRPDGSGARRVVKDASDPAWSPNGKRIAFARNGEIYTVAPDGRGIRRVTQTPRRGDGDPDWSPDGASLVYDTVRRAANPANDDKFLTISAADGTGARLLMASDPRFWVDSPAWRPSAR